MSVKDIQKAMLAKHAEQTGDDEGRVVPGEQQTYPDPGNRSPGTLDAHWGDAPPPERNGYPDHYGTGTLREAATGRGEFLDRIFENVDSASAEEKALVNQHFDTPVSERKPPHSPLLQKKASQHVRDNLTLRERVRSTIG